MITPDRIRRDFDAYLAQLPDQRPTVAPLLDLLDQGVDVTCRREWRGHLTASAVVVNQTGRILYVDHVVSGKWLLPGGHTETDDLDLGGTVLRELREETGLLPSHLEFITPTPLYVDAFPLPARESRGEPDHTHYDVVFALRTTHESLTLQADEVSAAMWAGPDMIHNSALRQLATALLERV